MKMYFTSSKLASAGSPIQLQSSKPVSAIKPSLRSSTNRFILNKAQPLKGMSCGCGK